MLALAADVPPIEIIHRETPSIAAMEDAFSPFGIRISEAPITPQRIVQLISDSALGRTR